jgi:hypothetical protein
MFTAAIFAFGMSLHPSIIVPDNGGHPFTRCDGHAVKAKHPNGETFCVSSPDKCPMANHRDEDASPGIIITYAGSPYICKYQDGRAQWVKRTPPVQVIPAAPSPPRAPAWNRSPYYSRSTPRPAVSTQDQLDALFGTTSRTSGRNGGSSSGGNHPPASVPSASSMVRFSTDTGSSQCHGTSHFMENRSNRTIRVTYEITDTIGAANPTTRQRTEVLSPGQKIQVGCLQSTGDILGHTTTESFSLKSAEYQ